jgi:phosphate starvation-inducible PhoH-like protein
LDTDSLKIEFETNQVMLDLLGPNDLFIKTLEKELEFSGIVRRGNLLTLPDADLSVKLFDLISSMKELILLGKKFSHQDLLYSLRLIKNGENPNFYDIFSNEINITRKGTLIRPRTPGQTFYCSAMEKKALVFCQGPAGTGKTYLAAALATRLLREKSISRILLTRPAIEAGEKIGFLPGELKDKVDPFFKPLYDAILDFIPIDRFQKYLERGTIEIAPLAFMRGRTLKDAFLILDEAQNTTKLQMKMFLTRIGHNSRAVITGDISQVDLMGTGENGLSNAVKVLSGLEEAEFVKLSAADVVRHDLVQRIVMAYESYGLKGV